MLEKMKTYLGVKFVENVLQIVPLDRLFGVEKLKELLDKLRRDVDFEGADLDRFVDDELQEELVDALEVGPGWVHLFLLVDTGLREAEVRLLDVGEGPEDILLDHLHDLVEVGDDDADNVLLVLEHLLELLNSIESLSLAEYVKSKQKR